MPESMTILLITVGLAVCLLLYGARGELFTTNYIYETEDDVVHVWRVYMHVIVTYQGEWSSIDAHKQYIGEADE